MLNKEQGVEVSTDSYRHIQNLIVVYSQVNKH